MRNRITFQATEDGTKIEGYTADTSFTDSVLEKVGTRREHLHRKNPSKHSRRFRRI